MEMYSEDGGNEHDGEDRFEFVVHCISKRFRTGIVLVLFLVRSKYFWVDTVTIHLRACQLTDKKVLLLSQNASKTSKLKLLRLLATK